MTEPAPAAPRVWREAFAVRAYEVGPDERASVLTLVDYCQEAAGHHARALGVERFDLGGGDGHWVLARFRLSVARYPARGETVTVETWPATEDGLRAERDSLLLGADEEPLARAVSTWFILDVARRRPARMPASVRALRRPERARALPPTPEEPAPPAGNPHEHPFLVRRADLDLHGHANNARFVEWALEAVPDPFYDAHRLTALDVVFQGEVHHGATVVSAAAPAGQGWAHRLTREFDGRVLALLHTTWAPA